MDDEFAELVLGESDENFDLIPADKVFFTFTNVFWLLLQGFGLFFL